MKRIKEVLEEEGIQQTWVAENWQKLKYGKWLCTKSTITKA